MWEKEKLLIMNNFSFSHSVLKRFFPKGIKSHHYLVNIEPDDEILDLSNLQTHKNKAIFGKGLKGYFLKVIQSWDCV